MTQNKKDKTKIKIEKEENFYSIPLTHLTGTFAKAFGKHNIKLPNISQLHNYIKDSAKGDIEKAVIYTPSAIGSVLVRNFADAFKQVRALTPHEVQLLSEYPPRDTNCITAMYTGQHCDTFKKNESFSPTLFDILDNKKVALITSHKSEVGDTLKGANIEIFRESYDGEVISRAIQLIKENKHDIFVIINQEYKDLMRVSQPYSKKALTAMDTHITAFELLANAAEVYLQDYNTLVGFAPDHGAHRSLLGFGTYGKYITEDMNVLHFYGVQPKNNCLH